MIISYSTFLFVYTVLQTSSTLLKIQYKAYFPANTSVNVQYGLLSNPNRHCVSLYKSNFFFKDNISLPLCVCIWACVCVRTQTFRRPKENKHLPNEVIAPTKWLVWGSLMEVLWTSSHKYVQVSMGNLVMQKLFYNARVTHHKNFTSESGW